MASCKLFSSCKTCFVAAVLILVTCDGINGQSVKTSRVKGGGGSRRKTSSRYTQMATYCDRPAPPNEGSIQCQRTNDLFSCTATCNEGYYFPDHAVTMTLDCSSKNGQWTPYPKFPDCTGVGSGSGYSQYRQSSSSWDSRNTYQTYGDRYQSGGSSQWGEQQKSLDEICEKLEPPSGASMQCQTTMSTYKCTATCQGGLHFPDGTTTTELECDTNAQEWRPHQRFPDCEGGYGKSSSSNYHQSQYNEQQQSGWHSGGHESHSSSESHSQWSHQQSSSFTCERPHPPNQGSMRCERTEWRYACTGVCRDGFQFFDGSTVIVMECLPNGAWSPYGAFPECSAGGSKSSGSYEQDKSNYVVSCDRPPAPVNGEIYCLEDSSKAQCQGTCNSGYQFPDGTSQKMLTCTTADGQWTPSSAFEDCQLTCHPPCENGGECYPQNQCVCSSGYRGNRCQYAISLCDFARLNAKMVAYSCSHNQEYTECQVSCPPGMTFNPPSTSLYRCTVDGLWNPPTPPSCERDAVCDTPPSPMNGKISCSGDGANIICTATCRPGFTFPDGTNEQSITCSYVTGQWTPSVNFPDCTAICSPECQNGGRCVGHNQCLCPAEYRGPQCEYASSLCDPSTFLGSVAASCQSDSEETVCQVHCGNTDAVLDPPEPTVYKCSMDGNWVPSTKPACHADYSKIDRRTEAKEEKYTRTGGSRTYTHYRNTSSWSSSSSSQQRQTFGDYSWQEDTSDSSRGRSSQEEIGQEPIEVSQEVVADEPVFKKVDAYKTGSSQKRGKHDMFDMQDMHENELEDTGEPRSPWEAIDVEVSSPYSGVCTVWGFGHYRTFDGALFTFPATCRYVLYEDCDNPTTAVTVQKNCARGSLDSCVREVGLRIRGETYILSPESGLTKEGIKHIKIPTTIHGITIRNISRYIMASLPTAAVWIDDEGTVSIVADKTKSVKEKCGLCGNMDGIPQNDFASRRSGEIYGLLTYGRKWKALDGSRDCVEADQIPLPCRSFTEDGRTVSDTATSRCQALKSVEFSFCHEHVDPEVYYRMCQMDCCSLGAPIGCECASMSEYFQECARVTGRKDIEWRTPALCSPQVCLNGSVYHECGTGCEPTCIVQNPACPTNRCVDGCHCPEGTVLEEGHCIPIEQCPCLSGDRKYQAGETLQQDCNTCLCQSGTWECTDELCPSVCSITGSHISTFDTVDYDVYLRCSHILVNGDNFKVIADYGSECRDSNFAVCFDSITIFTEEDAVVKLKPGFQVTVNDKVIHGLPISAPGIYVEKVTSKFVKAYLKNGLEVYWDGDQRIHVYSPTGLFGKVKGLCGTFSKQQSDEFLTPDGDVEGTAHLFAARWKAPGECHPIYTGGLPSGDTPCESRSDRHEEAIVLCNVLKGKTFEACTNQVDQQPFYQACLNAICACQHDDLESCLCDVLSSYAAICSNKGYVLPWRSRVPECAVHCNLGQVYEPCVSSCSYSCQNIAKGHGRCSEFCIDGCICPPGMTMDEHGEECVEVSACHCEHSGHRYPPGEKLMIGDEMCECSDAQWACREPTEEELTTPTPPPPACDEEKNKVPTDCVSECPLTCSNLHNHQPCTVATCESGCRCKDGFVLNEATDACVPPYECPCYHAGKSYDDGSNVKIECNDCVCRGSEWKCESKPCLGVCSSWGDSHYKTFDGHTFDFQGVCDYTLVQAKLSEDVTASIAVRNVPCGSGGATCSNVVIVTVGDYTLTLTEDEPMPPVEPNLGVTISQAGKFTLLHIDGGISLQWDRSTRFYITVQPIWKGKLKGLCGDFNGDATDDFKPPSGGIPLVLPHEFVNTWRVQDFCEKALPMDVACSHNPERREGARRRCAVIKSEMFQACHSLVDSESYYQRCIFDVCACDTGGDCACFCGVIGAYAYECARHGVPVSWRSQNLCPIQCESCDRYSPCISLCPPINCENLFEDAEAHSCNQEPCVEGCEHKPCPAGHVRAGPTNMTCVPREDCPLQPCTVINGVAYREGERIEDPEVGDACQSCYCRHGEIDCVGIPCTSAPPILTIAPPLEECLTGWTDWFNSVDPKENKDNDYEDLSELVTSRRVPCTMKQVKSVECREVVTGAPLDSTSATASCDVVDGMTCSGGQEKCPDYEMRIYCSCEEEEELCPPGETWSECAFECGASCHSLDHELQTKGQCSPSEAGKCIPGCVKEECKPPLLRRDLEVCVNSDMCTCSLESGYLLAPGEVVVNGCEKCQCLNNTLLCFTSKECEPTTVPLPSTTEAWLASEVTETKRVEPLVETALPVSVKPMTIPTVGPMTTPAACAYWSDWINRRQPSKGRFGSEREDTLPYILQQTEGFCREGEITEIECRDAVTDLDYTLTEDIRLVCSLDSGFHCKNYQQKNRKCGDYKIRYYCSCEEEEETTTTTIYVKPTTPTEIYPCSDFAPLIDGSHPLPDSHLKASSSSSSANGPQSARLSSKPSTVKGVSNGGAWTAGKADEHQFIEIDLGEIRAVYGVTTKGKDSPPEWVTSYYLLYSKDGKSYSYYPNEEDAPKVFSGNFDGSTEISHALGRPFEAKYVRLEPLTWEGQISLRFEILGCAEALPTVPPSKIAKPKKKPVKPPEEVCTDPMGLENGLIEDFQLSSSSSLDSLHSPQHGKLNTDNAWLPRVSDENQYLQVDFLEQKNITAIITKGNPEEPMWVTAFTVSYSNDGKVWNKVTDETGTAAVFPANYDSESTVENRLPSTLRARYLRIEPTKWKNRIALQIEILGCYHEIPCADPMGIGNGLITKYQISTSSEVDNTSEASDARLDSVTGWSPEPSEQNPYLQVDFLKPMNVTAVVTRGRHDIPHWVTSFILAYSDDGTMWDKIKKPDGNAKEFEGNFDKDSAVTNRLPEPIKARFFRIYPLRSKGGIGMRFEFLGCFEELVCLDPMGLENGILADGQISASSHLDDTSSAAHVRINDPKGWTAESPYGKQYIVVDFLDRRNVSAVVTKGSGAAPEWIKKYKVSYSHDGLEWLPVLDESGYVKIFEANKDSQSPVVNLLPETLETRYISVLPLDLEKTMSMRLEILGCYHPYVCMEPMGMENGAITNHQLSASSSRQESLSPENARIDSDTAWSPETLKENEFLQVDFVEPTNVTALTTKGRNDEPEWVTVYYVSYSEDGKNWMVLEDPQGNVKEFPANYDSDSPVTVKFPESIIARYLRIYPLKWNKWISMRLEVLGCYHPHVCMEPMGLENEQLTDSQISASSFRDETSEPSKVRLNSATSWTSAVVDGSQYLQVEFDEPRNITAVVTKGREDENQWVESYSVEYSYDGDTWMELTDIFGTPLVFKANENSDMPVINVLPQTLETKYIRIIPMSWKDWISMRLELLGCYHPIELEEVEEEVKPLTVIPTIPEIFPGCPDPNDIETDLLNTAQITASSSAPNSDPDFVRISHPVSDDSGLAGAWVPHVEDLHPVLFIEFPEEMPLTAVRVQGREDEEQWVKSLRIIASTDNRTWLPVFGPNGEEIIGANSDQTTIVGHYFKSSVNAKFVKVIPESWHLWPSFRMELIGCYHPPASTVPPTEEATTIPTPPVPVELCPELDPSFLSSCPESCLPGLLCNGKECVDPIDCTCYHDGQIFQVSDRIEDENCMQCDCALGGKSKCNKKTCPACPKGQRQIWLEKCQCGCEGCKEEEILCPSSGECIPKERWCDGTVDCPDDETDCVEETTEITTTEIPTTTEAVKKIENDTCGILGKHIKTLDGQEIEYDHCHHVALKDIVNGSFVLSIHKDCMSQDGCIHWIEFMTGSHKLKVTSHLEVTLNGNKYTTSQLAKLNRKSSINFTVEKVGDQVVIKFPEKSLKIIYDVLAHLKLQVSQRLWDQVSGLCGYYSGVSTDDQQKPDGQLAYTSQEFGDSWAVDSYNEQCIPSTCPDEVMMAAVETCIKLKEEPFSHCADVVLIDTHVDLCMSALCDCMQNQNSTEEKCKCESYLPFVEECENKLGPAVLRNWRLKVRCAPDCPPGLVWNDCGPSCLITCDTPASDIVQCSEECMAGCFCPDGTVLNGDDCVPPERCSDKVCQGFGDPHLETFDGLFLPFLGKGTFLITASEKLDFSVEGITEECPSSSYTTCLVSLIVKHHGHVVTASKGSKIVIDGMDIPVENLPVKVDGLTVMGFVGDSYIILIPSLSVEARYYGPNSGFAIKVPSRRFFNRTTGLCGNCDDNLENEIQHDTKAEFVCSWLTEGNPESCKSAFPDLPEVITTVPNCEILLDDMFTPCHALVDPKHYIEACSFDVKHTSDEKGSVCKSLMEYSRQCCQAGIEIKGWEEKFQCEVACESNLVFSQCHDSCSQTCEGLKNRTLTPDCECLKLDGCFCPEGKALKNGQCIDPLYCETCDSEGHVPGDVWKEGPCKSCICTKTLLVECVVETCPPVPVCGKDESLAKHLHDNETCCDSYSCVPAPVLCPPLEELPRCPEGEVAKIQNGEDMCPEFKCECDPLLCSPIVWPTDLEEGQSAELQKQTCCPKVKVVCKQDTCPDPLVCQPGFELVEVEGECCPRFRCKPLTDVCLYTHESVILDEWQRAQKNLEAELVVYKLGDVWSDGLCTNCTCVESGGQYVPQCRKEQCMPLADRPENKEYELYEYTSPSKCCPDVIRLHCKDEYGNLYMAGEEWQSVSDPCVKFICELTPSEDVQKVKKVTSCPECPKTSDYLPPSKILGQCCGICRPSKCEDDDIVYSIGDSWTPKSNPCMTAECVNAAGVPKIIYTTPSCPSIPEGCPLEKIVRDEQDCCDVCNVTSEIHCIAAVIPREKTVGLFSFYNSRRGGLCRNVEEIPDALQCTGACHSESYYSLEDGDFKSNCKCCKVNVTVSRKVKLRCPDGSVMYKTFRQPETCECSKCAPDERSSYGKPERIKTKTSTKTHQSPWTRLQNKNRGFQQEEFRGQQQQDFSFQQEPQDFGFQQEPQEVGFQQEPQEFGFQQEPQEFGFQQEPQDFSFQQEPQSFSFQQEPQDFSFQQEPQDFSFQQKPENYGFNSQHRNFGHEQEQEDFEFQREQEPDYSIFNSNRNVEPYRQDEIF